jgi:hypothetical protein
MSQNFPVVKLLHFFHMMATTHMWPTLIHLFTTRKSEGYLHYYLILGDDVSTDYAK